MTSLPPQLSSGAKSPQAMMALAQQFAALPQAAPPLQQPLAAKTPLPAPPTALLMGRPNPVIGNRKPEEPESALNGVVSDLVNPDEAVNAHQLGRVEFSTKLLAGGVIALLGSLSVARPSMALAEILGFGGFYGAMALSPHIIHALVKAKTGLNLDHEYLSTQGDKRGLFTDPQFLPLQLLPEEEIQKFGDKLGVPKHLDNRRKVIEDRIRSVMAQAQTWWMLGAGPLVPIAGSLVGRLLEPPAQRALNHFNQWRIQQGLSADAAGKPKQAQRLNKLINTSIGDLPNSELAQWWQQLEQDGVKMLGLTKAFAKADKAAKPYGQEHWGPSWLGLGKLNRGQETEFTEKLVNELLDLSPASIHGANDSGGERLRKLQERLTSHFAPKLDELARQTSEWIDTYAKESDKPALKHQLKAKITANRAQLNHFERLIDGLLNAEKRPSRHWIKTMISNTTVPNVVNLLEKGEYGKVAQLIDSSDKALLDSELLPTLAAKQQNKGQVITNQVGGTILNQLKNGIREGLNSRRFMRVFGLGVGGTIAALSAIYYTMVLGRPHKRKQAYVRSPEAILKKYNVSNQFEKRQQELAIQKAQRAVLEPRNTQFDRPGELKQMFRQNQAVIYALNVRTFGAKDANNDGRVDPTQNEQGTFLSSIERLDELKALGVNTLHLLPINPPGVIKQAGNAGSVYATGDYHALNPQLADKTSPLNITEQARLFVEEAHKRGIKVMVDVPSCAAYDLALTRPDLIAVDENGHTLTPSTWADIVMFKNDAKLKEYFEGFFDLMANDIGVDGFRVDVARARPNWFWKHFIDKYPNHAWLAESYVEEDASPLQNIPRDIPEQFLSLGFDSIYGQNHIFHKLPSGQAYTNYLTDIAGMFSRANKASGNVAVPNGKSVIGSFLTHDDEETLMDHGGVAYTQMASVLNAFQPYTNPYIIDGMQTGYPHRIDIFNYTTAHKGEHPELADFMRKVFTIRKRYANLLANGKYAQAIVDRREDPNHMVFAYTLKQGNQKLLVVGNKDVNARVEATVNTLIPPNAQLTNIVPEYGRQSVIQRVPEGLHVNLGPARVMVFDLSN